MLNPERVQLCDWCEEPIQRDELCHQIPYIGDPEKPFLYFHRECAMRQITGSLAHVMERCGCYVPGATDSDPLDMSRRDAARAAVKAFELKMRLRNSQ
jgi:hypothetical protein